MNNGTLAFPDGAATKTDTGTTGGVQTVVTPATNVNGIRIWQIFARPGSASIRVMAHTAAPAGYTDADAHTLAIGVASNAFGDGVSSQAPIYVPPGFGLYYARSSAASAVVSISYEVM